MNFENIAIIGAGAWGTALAQAGAIAGRKVKLFTQTKQHAEQINQSNQNLEFLGEQLLSKNITAHFDKNELAGSDVILLVVPAQASRIVLSEIKQDFLVNLPVILCAKGLEEKTLLRQSEILAEIAPNAIPFILSGPSFAKDVAAGLPTAVTLAGLPKNQQLSDNLAKALSSASFRLYSSSDIIGVELAGALKNVYALACGAVEGAGLGASARAAIIARAYAEMVRLIIAMGGTEKSMATLAGIGDLTLSCTSAQSRNYLFGKYLGEGKTIAQIKQAGAKLAEGVISSPVALALAKKYQIDSPLIKSVNLLLNNSANIEQIVINLMSRPLKREGN